MGKQTGMREIALLDNIFFVVGSDNVEEKLLSGRIVLNMAEQVRCEDNGYGSMKILTIKV